MYRIKMHIIKYTCETFKNMFSFPQLFEWIWETFPKSVIPKIKWVKGDSETNPK